MPPRFKFIPPDALDRRRELSRGAWDLFELYCSYRNKDTGLCCPSLETLSADLSRTYRHVSDMKSELARKGWIRRTGRHSVELLVGSFPAPVVRSFGKNPDESARSFGKNPETRRASFGKNPETDRPLIRNEQLEEKAAAANSPDPLREKVTQSFVESVIEAGVYPEEFVRWVWSKLKLHCVAAGVDPIRKQLLHWLANETGAPPVQLSLLSPPPVAGAFGAVAEASAPPAPLRAPDPECRLCGGAGSRDGRSCPCTLCPHCSGSGMEVISGKGAKRCRCRSPQVITTVAPGDGEELQPQTALEQERSTG